MFLIFAVLFKGHSQNVQLIDSLKNQLKQSSGEKRYKLLNAIGWEFRFANQDSTIWYAEQAYELGTKLSISKDLARSLSYIGVAYNYKGDRIKAYEYYLKGLRLSEKQKDTTQIAYSNNNLSRLFFDQGVLSKSYSYCITALTLFKHLNDSSGLAYSYQSLGNLYRVQKDFGKSEINFQEALKIRKKLGNKRDVMSALVYLGNLYKEKNQPANSTKYYLMADSVGQLINDVINLADIKIRLAENYLKEGKVSQAALMAESGFEVIVRAESRGLLPNANVIMGKVCLAQNNVAGAKFYFESALKISTEIHEISSQIESYFQLAEMARRSGQKQQELELMNHYLILRDSVKDLELARQAERVQFQLEIEGKDRENDLLKIDQARKDALISKQQIQNIGLLIIALLACVISFIVWNNGRKNRIINTTLALQNEQIIRQREEIAKSNDRLSRRNQQLSDLNHEKDTLMNIVAHDLKSPLNRIFGLVRIMEMEGQLNTNQQEYLKLMKQATKAGTDLITDLLDVSALQETNGARHRSTFDLNELMNERTASFHTAASSKNIQLKVDCNFPSPFTSDANYINRILDNLISNAIKFSPSNSEIVVSGRYENKHATLKVKDHGPGFSPQDKTMLFQKFRKLSARPTAGESSNGLGLAIVKTLVDRLGGTIDLKSEPSDGSEFIVKVPNEQAI